MAKQTSLFGKISGKLGAVVFSTSGGELISREYNPHVANPSTVAQVDQRARMKLMSQLSACLAPVIAMRKEGLTSARNKFVQKNFGYSYASDGNAQISYENVQLTSGNAGLPMLKWTIDAPQGQSPVLIPFFEEEPSTSISRIVYCLFKKTDEGKLSYMSSQIITERGAGDNGYFEGAFSGVNYSTSDGALTSNYVIYAYGMSDTSERASVQYGNLNVQNATDLARLIATRTINYEDFQFTQTRGTSASQGENSSTEVPAGSARVFVTALGSGTVSGSGTFELGTQVTVVATPNQGATFVGWRVNGQQNYISRQASYTFTLNQQADLIAVFEGSGNDSL